MSSDSKGPKVAVVRQMPGEPCRFQVRSASNPNEWHLCDIAAHDGAGECSCKRWATVCWVLIRDTHNLPPSRRCRHLRASRELALNLSIANHNAQQKTI